MIGLTADQKIPFPNPEFDNESVRYKHRFAAFSTIGSPTPVHYLHYRSIADNGLSQGPGSMYSGAAKHFNQAKAFLEAIPDAEKDVSFLKVKFFGVYEIKPILILCYR